MVHTGIDGIQMDAEPLPREGELERLQIQSARRRLNAIELLSAIPHLFARISTLHRHLGVLKPSFLTARPSTTSQPPRPTAWLDGLRGCASFVVFIYHFQYQYHSVYDMGYGSNKGVDDYWIIQFPVFRVFFYGVPQVSIFWVLSGVALSLRPLQLVRAQDWNKLMSTLFSSVFRRMLRLYLPCLIVSIGILIGVLLGFYDYADRRKKEDPFFHMTELNPPLMPTISAQIADWARATWRWTNPLAPKHKYLYNPHLWTIPTEAADSVLLFATLIAHSKLKPRIRVGCIATLYTYLLLQGHSDMSLFLAGMACAEYILVLAEDDKQLPIYEPKATKSLATTITQRIPKWLWLVSLYTSAHFLSFPNRGGASAFGFSTLAKFSPSSVQPATFWRTIGATLLLFTLAGGKFLQILFSNSYTVYLGKISFPLYLVHGPLNHMIGYRLVPFYWHFTGSDTFVSYETGVLLAGCTVAVILIWFADFLERVVDQPSVNFGRWLQKQWSV